MTIGADVCHSPLARYDFALFGFFSDVIGKLFFAPSEGNDDDDVVDMGGEIDTKNLMHSFAVFGGAFLMRPVGGLVIGYVGDRHGRKRALVLVRRWGRGGACVRGRLPLFS